MLATNLVYNSFLFQADGTIRLEKLDKSMYNRFCLQVSGGHRVFRNLEHLQNFTPQILLLETTNVL